MTLKILSGTDTKAVAQAAQALQQGQLVAFATETVYGLGADADQDDACKAVFTVKGRPTNHPLIVHVSSAKAAVHYTDDIPEFAHKLIQTFWPGPLTIIVKRKAGVGCAAAGGQNTIGLRCPSHPVAQALLQAFEAIGGHGIAAPSANRFGRTSPTTAQHVAEAFADEEATENTSSVIAMVLDGGACDVGIESTIIDCSRNYPVLLRPGVLTRAEIEKAAGMVLSVCEPSDENTPHAPGTLPAHYAPKAKVRLMDSEHLKIALGMVAADKPRNDVLIGVYARNLPSTKAKHIIMRQMPHSAKDTAHELFAILHDFDSKGVSLLWIETPPNEPQWLGVSDRLLRAQAAG